jgi:ubiquinone/menaquinone biosynthesis C-methylase UbiE
VVQHNQHTTRSQLPEPDRTGPARWFFDTWSRVYDIGLVQRLTYRPVHDAVLSAIRARAPRSILDVGCGTGLLTARLRRSLPGARVVGCDFSTGMLRRAAHRDGDGNGDGPRWVRADAQRLPFAGGSFDAIVCTEAFHWFPDQDVATREFFRVLGPNGSLLVALVNPPVELVSDAVHRGSQLLGEPLYWPTQAAMRRRVEAAGFRVESQHRIWRIPAGLLLPPVLTVARRPGWA